MPETKQLEHMHRVANGVVPETLIEAQCFHDGFVAGLKKYAEFIGSEVNPKKNPDLQQLIDDQVWKTIEHFERISPSI